MAARFLIVDGTPSIAVLLRLTFDQAEINLMSDAGKALHEIAAHSTNVAVFHSCAAGMPGVEFVRQAKRIDPALSVVLTSDCGKVSEAIQAMQTGAYDYLTTPTESIPFGEVMVKALEANLVNRQQRDDQRAECEAVDPEFAVGSSPRLMEIWKLVGRIADTDATVLIRGESGTGKELLARTIHSHSRRRDRPFVAVNCAALPDALFEAEMFGHEKGAFTGAHARRIGKFESCQGGTILLDEVGEMSLASQAKLLRVLENQGFERVGGNETLRCDIRVIACTHQDLEQAIAQRRFRLDLYHRLRVISFTLPPLRERREDIPALADLFCRSFAARYGKGALSVSARGKRALMEHLWPGNIRELKNVMNSAVAASAGRVLGREDFEPILGGPVALGDDPPPGEDYYGYFVKLLWPGLDRTGVARAREKYRQISQGLEKSFIHFVLARCNYNQVHASRLLGVSRNTLRGRISQYHIKEPSELN